MMNNHVLTVYTDRVQREVKVQYSTSISVYKHDTIVSDTGLRSRNTVPRTHTHTHTQHTYTHTHTHTHTHIHKQHTHTPLEIQLRFYIPHIGGKMRVSKECEWQGLHNLCSLDVDLIWQLFCIMRAD